MIGLSAAEVSFFKEVEISPEFKQSLFVFPVIYDLLFFNKS